MTQQEQPTGRVIVGTLTGMESRSQGWMRYSIQEPGRQYPQRADTKKSELIQQCGALMGQVVKVRINDVDSTNINPHTNSPYVNHYLEKIAVAVPGEVSQQAPVAGANQPQQTTAQQAPEGAYVPAQVKELHIMREKAAELAIEMAAKGLLPIDQHTPAGLVAAAETWVAYFEFGPTRFGVTAFDGTAPEGDAWQTGGEPQHQQISFGDPGSDAPPPDDEIPF